MFGGIIVQIVKDVSASPALNQAFDHEFGHGPEPARIEREDTIAKSVPVHVLLGSRENDKSAPWQATGQYSDPRPPCRRHIVRLR